MIYLLGDSITVGSPGVPYYRYFKNVGSYQKHGLGGDTISGLLRRVEKIEFSEDGSIIIEIGTNDILLRFLHDTYQSWTGTIDNIEKSGRTISPSIDVFTEKFLEILNKFKGRKVLVVSIPCIGEDIESKLNEKVDSYNEIIQELCKRSEAIFINFNKWQKEEINRKNQYSRAFISEYPIGMILDVLLTKSQIAADLLSKNRNLVTTIDGVHLNSIGARGLAKLIEDELLNGGYKCKTQLMLF